MSTVTTVLRSFHSSSPFHILSHLGTHSLQHIPMSPHGFLTITKLTWLLHIPQYIQPSLIQSSPSSDSQLSSVQRANNSDKGSSSLVSVSDSWKPPAIDRLQGLASVSTTETSTIQRSSACFGLLCMTCHTVIRFYFACLRRGTTTISMHMYVKCIWSVAYQPPVLRRKPTKYKKI